MFNTVFFKNGFVVIVFLPKGVANAKYFLLVIIRLVCTTTFQLSLGRFQK